MPHLWTLGVRGGLKMENKKFCTFKFNSYMRNCDKEKCAWWCEWANCCAMVAVPSEISDRAHDIMQTIQN